MASEPDKGAASREQEILRQLKPGAGADTYEKIRNLACSEGTRRWCKLRMMAAIKNHLHQS